MQPKSTGFLPLLGLVQLLALLFVGFLPVPQFSSEWLRLFATGIFLGSGFASVSSAATWTALGPFRLAVRLPCALTWVLMTGLLMMFNVIMSSEGASYATMEALSLAMACLILWIVVQTPLWIARAIYGFRIDRPLESDAAPTLGEHQFGIRQLLIVTAVIGAAMGTGRLLVLSIKKSANPQGVASPDWEIVAILGLFLVSNTLVAFLVVTGALLPQRWRLAVGISIAAAAAITVVESAFCMLFPGGPPSFWHVLALLGTMNGLQFGLMLVSLLLLRAAGYKLVKA